MVDSVYLALFFEKIKNFSQNWFKWSKILAHTLTLESEKNDEESEKNDEESKKNDEESEKNDEESEK